MEDRLMEVLNSTLTKYNTIRNNGNYELADQVFIEVIAQARMVEAVTDKRIKIEGNGKAVLV